MIIKHYLDTVQLKKGLQNSGYPLIINLDVKLATN